MSNLAVAANPPVHTGTAPAPAGDSSPTVAPADVAGGADKAFPHSPISSHGPTGAACYYCNKALTALNAGGACPDREHIERDKRVQDEAPAMLGALREAIVRVAVANREGDPILSAWLPTAQAILARIDGRA